MVTKVVWISSLMLVTMTVERRALRKHPLVDIQMPQTRASRAPRRRVLMSPRVHRTMVDHQCQIWSWDSMRSTSSARRSGWASATHRSSPMPRSARSSRIT